MSLAGKSGPGKSTRRYIRSAMDTAYEGSLILLTGERLTGRDGNARSRFRNEHVGFAFRFGYLLH